MCGWDDQIGKCVCTAYIHIRCVVSEGKHCLHHQHNLSGFFFANSAVTCWDVCESDMSNVWAFDLFFYLPFPSPPFPIWPFLSHLSFSSPLQSVSHAALTHALYIYAFCIRPAVVLRVSLPPGWLLNFSSVHQYVSTRRHSSSRFSDSVALEAAGVSIIAVWSRFLKVQSTSPAGKRLIL